MSTAAYHPAFHDQLALTHALARSWWPLLLRGIAAVVFGLLAFAWPGLTLGTLILFYGAFAMADGLLALWAAFAGERMPMRTWWLVVEGLLGIAIGCATFVYPGLTAVLLVMFVGAWALAHGALQVAGAIRLRKEIDNEWLLILGGLVSVTFGALVLLSPGAGALALVWMIAGYTFATGILLIGFAIRVKQAGKRLAARTTST